MVKFSWELLCEFTANFEDDEEWGEGEEKAYEEQKYRLKKADDVTQEMSREEYIYYAECRQASFTFKKLKRFRDWCDMQK